MTDKADKYGFRKTSYPTTKYFLGGLGSNIMRCERYEYERGESGAVIKALGNNKPFDNDGPFAQPSIFVEFSEMKEFPESMIAFCSKYGFLTADQNKQGQANLKDLFNAQKKVAALWQLYKCAVKVIVTGVDSQAAMKELKKLVVIESANSQRFSETPHKEVGDIFGPGHWVDFRIMKEHDFIKRVDGLPFNEVYAAFEYINDNVTRRINIRGIQLSSRRPLLNSYQDWDESQIMSYRPAMIVPDLLTLMYLRFYWLLTTDQHIRHCKYCGDPFIPATGKIFYCDLCRSNLKIYGARRTAVSRANKKSEM